MGLFALDKPRMKTDHMNTSLLLAALGLYVSLSSASASTFSVACDHKREVNRQGCTIKQSGTIERGDADRLRQVIREPLNGAWIYDSLVLDSPGGEVDEALKVATVVRDAMLRTDTTYLIDNDVLERMRKNHQPLPKSQFACVSACFLVWISGTEHGSITISGNLRGGPVGIGLHRPYFATDAYTNTPSKIAEAQQSMTAIVREYLRREQVPEIHRKNARTFVTTGVLVGRRARRKRVCTTWTGCLV
jgi:hypothetical protein